MSSPANNVHVGSIMGTGADIAVHSMGFCPKAIQFFNDDGDSAWWQKDMDDDSMLKTVDTTGVCTLVTSNGVTPQADGFLLGADADLNQSTKRIFYTAWCE